MNLYEHTIIARQDTSPSEIKQLTEKYSKIVEKNDGKIIKTENWGLINLSHTIKKKLLRYLTVKVKKFDLETVYFGSKSDKEKKETLKN